jgi:hypothetical protein
MTASAGFELAEDLVLRAKAAGFDVSTEQIARWNRVGLLPKPHQHGLGQGNGSEIRYPLGTGDQLLALCSLHKQFRKLENVGWYLWLNGYQVAEKYWRKPLTDAVLYFDGNRQLFKKKILDTAYGIVSVRRSGQNFLDSLSGLRVENRHFRRARRRIGASNFSEFSRIIVTIAVGAYRADAESNERDSAAEREVIESGLGLLRARIDRLENGQPLLTGDIEPILEKFSARLAKATKLMMLRTISSGEINCARDELRLLFTGLQNASIKLENKHGKHPFGLHVIVEFGTVTEIRLQALMILLFATTIRTDPDNKLREILSIFRGNGVSDGRQLDPCPSSS